MIERGGRSSEFLSRPLFRLGVIAPSLQVATAPSTHGSTSPSRPLQLEVDHRAMPPASVALALIPLVLLLVLALRRDSSFRQWWRISLKDFVGLFSSIRRRRHVIHDQPYLDQVLEAEFGELRPPSGSAPPSVSPSSRPSPEASTTAAEGLLPNPDEARDRPS